jgi:pseudomonalisin
LKTKLTCVLTVLTFALLLVSVAPNANAQSWASTTTQAYPVSTLSNATLIGALSPTTQVHVVLGLQEQNASQVQPTLLAQLTPGNALYGTTMTVPQFAAQFGATSAQITAVTDYLTSTGFDNITVSPNSLMIDAYGTAADAEAAFNTSLTEYSFNGATVFLNTTAAQVPASLSGIVVAVLGLNNVVRLHSDLVRLLQTSPQPAAAPCTPPDCPLPDTSNTTFTPQQYQIAYDAASSDPSAQLLSTGESTAVGEIAEGDVTQSVLDLREFEAQYSLPEVPVTVVYAGIESADTSGLSEWDLDTQYATGIANQVSHLYYYVATSLTDSDLALAINKAVTQNVVKAFNMSLGECEFYPYIDGAMLVDDESFGEAALHGITPFASADDNGSACPSEFPNGVPLGGPPDTAYPASSPYVISVGGTNLFTNTNYSYDYEVAWQASGGGPSYFEAPPFWEEYTGSGDVPIVLSAAANSEVGCPMGCRGVPDTAMCAGGDEEPICAAIVWSAPTTAAASDTNPIDILSPGPQPTNSTGCTVSKHCILSAWVTNSNTTTMADITSPITAPFYVMSNGGGTPLTPTSATGLICLADTNNLIAPTIFAQIAANCVAGGGVALIMYPDSDDSAPSTIPVFTIATEADGNFLANGVTGASTYDIRIDVAAPAPSSSLWGGTSLSAPLAMGSWARIETSHKNKLGFAGPLIYQLANGAPTLTSPYFNDVVLGTNGLYDALPGWDFVTGLGSWNILVVNKNIPTTYPQ